MYMQFPLITDIHTGSHVSPRKAAACGEPRVPGTGTSTRVPGTRYQYLGTVTRYHTRETALQIPTLIHTPGTIYKYLVPISNTYR